MIERGGNLGKGVACGAAAGALWGLVFLAPELAGAFSPIQLAAGRYLAFGVIAAVLAAPRRARILTHLGAREWRALVMLSLSGNIVYYMLLAAAVRMGGIALTSLVIGFMPVAVTILGSRGHGAVSLRKLAPSLLLGAAGIACVGWEAFAHTASARPSAPLGFLCALGALASWTAYAVSNSHWLARLPHISEHDWNLLTGVVTGALALLLIPAAFLGENLGAHTTSAWTLFIAVSSGVAVFASVIGNAFWNSASRLLPLTLVGGMILFETLFALLYAFLWERRGPGAYESVALVLISAAVLLSVRAHRRPAPGIAHPGAT